MNKLIHMDELIDSHLREERVCDAILPTPRLQKRQVLEENNEIQPRISVLEDSDNEDLDEDVRGLNISEKGHDEREPDSKKRRKEDDRKSSRKDRDHSGLNKNSHNSTPLHSENFSPPLHSTPAPRPKRATIARTGSRRTAAPPISTSTNSDIQKAGAVYTFGVNVAGQLGFNAEQRKFPALVTTLRNINIKAVEVKAGGMHTIVLSEDGKVYSFGCNDEGALGRNTASEDSEEADLRSTTPTEVQIPTKNRIVQITAGACHSAALDADGDVFAWGTLRDGNGHFGLIVGGETIQNLPAKLSLPSTIKNKVTQETKVKSIGSGNDHLILLTTTGKVLTLGSSFDTLGRSLPRRLRNSLSEKVYLLTPTTIHIPKDWHRKRILKFSHIWTGSSVTFVREEKNGDVYAFGMNSCKQLGVIDDDRRMIPIPIVTAEITKLKFSEIVVGEFHCLGLVDGKVYSWGKPLEGQLGLGKSHPMEAVQSGHGRDSDEDEEMDVDQDDPTPKEDVHQPTLVTSLPNNIVQIAAGHSVSYALSQNSPQDTTLYAWGFGENWQLGYGDTEDQLGPSVVLAKMRGEPAKGIWKVSSGSQHTCLIAEDGLN